MAKKNKRNKNLWKNVRQRGNSYQIRIYCGADINGKQIMRTMTWKPETEMSESDLEDALMEQLVQFRKKCRLDPLPVAMDFKRFADIWFDEYAQLNLRSTSYERMYQLRGRVYASRLGNLRIDKITGRDVQRFINDLALNGKNEKTGNPLARKTVVHYLSFISDVFSYAVKMDLAPENPCRKVSVPKGEKKEKEIYTVDEVEKLFELLETAPLKYRTFFTLALYSGMRRGELLGLEWKDVDWANGVISVRRTSNYTAKKGIYTDTTKTKRSQRSQKLPPVVMDLLEKYRMEQDEERIIVGDQWVDSDRLFIKWDGSPMNNNTPYFWFKEFCTDNDFRFCDIHSMRHFYATALINVGVDPATVSGALGHSLVSTTTSIYCHVFQEAQAKAGNAIASVLDFSKKKQEDEDKEKDKGESVPPTAPPQPTA